MLFVMYGSSVFSSVFAITERSEMGLYDVPIFMTRACLFVCVVGPGFDSTFPVFLRSRASHAAGSDGRFAKKNESDPHLWRQGCVDTICTDVVCSIPTSCRLCLFGTASMDYPCLRLDASAACN